MGVRPPKNKEGPRRESRPPPPASPCISDCGFLRFAGSRCRKCRQALARARRRRASRRRGPALAGSYQIPIRYLPGSGQGSEQERKPLSTAEREGKRPEGRGRRGTLPLALEGGGEQWWLALEGRYRRPLLPAVKEPLILRLLSCSRCVPIWCSISGTSASVWGRVVTVICHFYHRAV